MSEFKEREGFSAGVPGFVCVCVCVCVCVSHGPAVAQLHSTL